MNNNILITGANGKIASAVISKIIENNNLFLFSRDKNKLIEKYGFCKNVNIFSYDDLKNFQTPIDIILHCACERSVNIDELAKSKELGNRVIKLAKDTGCKRFINISSQAVYDMKNSKFWSEDDKENPNDKYGKLKLSLEKDISSILAPEKYINVRLTALTGENYPQHILYKFITFALNNGQIQIKGGKQNFAFMNFKDAIDAFMIMLNLDVIPKYNVYNVGNNEQYNIIDMAEEVKKVLNASNKQVEILLEKNENIIHNAKMNSSRFMNEFNWKPKYSLKDSINEILNKEYV